MSRPVSRRRCGSSRSRARPRAPLRSPAACSVARRGAPFLRWGGRRPLRMRSGSRRCREMNRQLGALATQVCLLWLGVWRPRDAFAQGLPAPGPGGTLPVPDSGGMIVPTIILVVVLLGGLIAAVVLTDRRRKRQAQAIAIEGQLSDVLMREPRLAGTVITTVAHVPLSGRAAPTVEVRGEVEYPELRDMVLRLVQQELLRFHPEGRVEDRIFVAPPVHAGGR